MSTAHAVGDSSSSDDADFNFESNVESRRYPVHDCCEFEDAESLRRLIFVRQDDSDSSSASSSSSSEESDDEESASSDEEHAYDNSKQIVKPSSSGAPSRSTLSISLSMGSMSTQINNKKKERQEDHGTNEEEKEGKYGNEDSIAIDKSKVEEKKVPLQEQNDSEQKAENSVAAKESLLTLDNGDSKSSTTKDAAPENCLHGDTSSKEVASSDNQVNENDKTSITVAESAVSQNIKHEATASKTNTSIESTISKSTKDEMEIANNNKNTTPSPGQKVTNTSPSTTTSSPAPAHPKNHVKKTSLPKLKKKHKPPQYYCPYDLNERDEDENTPLHIAIHARKLASIRLLLEAGANIHKKCDGSAPVHTCISIGSIPVNADFATQCLTLLKQHGADFSAKDESLHTPLYLACLSNLPDCVSAILADVNGMTTLNLRADRIGSRALHICAKMDRPPRGGRRVSRHPLLLPGSGNNGSRGEENAPLTRLLLGVKGVEIDPVNNYGRTPLHVAAAGGNWAVARLLLRSGANPAALDRRGFTPGKLAAKRGMVVPNDLVPHLGGGAAMPLLGSAHGSGRDLIMDPDASTIIICHEICSRHRSCPPITRGGVASDPPPENVRRLHVLINDEVGILKSNEFVGCAWEVEARRANMADILKVHEYTYVEKISQLCMSIPDHPCAIASLDPDTAVSRWSFEAALRAAGAVCEAVDKVISGDHRNAFCAVRPPGHHAGPRGIVACPNDPDGSHGFCLLNNVAIGAAYARSMYRNDGIKKVAIVDFDVHHGNGTEEIVRNLIPHVQTSTVRTPFAIGTLQTSKYRPWLDENDVQDVFFASTHGYGPRDARFVDNMQPNQGGWFYPASGKTGITDAIKNPSLVESLPLSDFLLTQTWTRMGEEARRNCCKIINVGLELPRHHDVPGMQRIDLRDSYRKNILPKLMAFSPDIIFISAGFDGHKRDTMNFGYVGMIEDDYEWLTEQLVKVANATCHGRIVSVLEGGYKIHGGVVSPFARSVASHVRALVEGGCSREVYDEGDAIWESRFERHMVDEKERRRQAKLEKLKAAQDMDRRRLRHGASGGAEGAAPALATERPQHQEVKTVPMDTFPEHGSSSVGSHHHGDMEGILKEPLVADTNPIRNQQQRPSSLAFLESSLMNDQPIFTPRRNEEEDDGVDETPRKRKRAQVDYKELFEQMKKESGFTG